MSIWTYAQQTKDIEILKHNGEECFFCHATMIELRYIGETFVNEGFSSTRIFGCPSCGWWRAYELVERRMYRRLGFTVQNTIEVRSRKLTRT